MTEQEAIKIFKDRLELTDYRKQVPEYYEAMELAVKALERQIPKKPIKHETPDNYPFYVCPCCCTTDVERHEYCFHCGQKLNLSEVE